MLRLPLTILLQYAKFCPARILSPHLEHKAKNFDLNVA